MGEIIYISLYLIFVLDICCEATNIYKLSEMVCREGEATIWVISKCIKLYFLHIVFVLTSWQALCHYSSIVWLLFVFLNKCMDFLFVWPQIQ